jgi:hypothetical protein
MINISPIFGQSRAKKKEILLIKIAKRFHKTDPYGSTFQKRTATLSFNVGRVGLSWEGGWKWSVRKQWAGRHATEHRFQAGAQAYREVVLSQNDMERFKIVKSICSAFGSPATTARLQQMWSMLKVLWYLRCRRTHVQASVGGQQFKFTKL